MSIKEIRTPEAPLPIGPYSQAVEIKNMVFISGILPVDPSTQEIVQTNYTEASNRIFKNLDAILKAGNLNKTNIVKVTIFVKDIRQFSKINEAYGLYFKELEAFPARSTVQVAALPKDAEIEMDFIAVK